MPPSGGGQVFSSAAGASCMIVCRLCSSMFARVLSIDTSEHSSHVTPHIPISSASSRQQAAGSRQQAAGSKQQAASSKQQAASSKQRAASSKQQAASSEQRAASSKQRAASSKRQASMHAAREHGKHGTASTARQAARSAWPIKQCGRVQAIPSYSPPSRSCRCW